MKTSLRQSFARAAFVALAAWWAAPPTAATRAAEIQRQEPAGYTSRIDGPGAEEVYDTCTDAQGNVYVVGRFSSAQGTVDVVRDLAARSVNGTDADQSRFGPSQSESFTNSSNANTYDIFVIKYDRDGKVLWKRTAGDTTTQTDRGHDYASGVAVDAKGNVFVTGAVTAQRPSRFGSVTLTPKSFSGGPYPGQNLFVAALDADGNWQWASLMDFSVYASNTLTDSNVGTLPGVFYFRLASDTFVRNSNDVYGATPPRAASRTEGHALQLGPDGSVYIKGIVQMAVAGTFSANVNNIFWLRSPTGSKLPLAYMSQTSSGQATKVFYSGTAFVAKLAATAPAIGSASTAQTTYAWDWIAPVSNNVATDSSGNITYVQTSGAESGSDGRGTQAWSPSVSTIGDMAVDDTSIYLTGTWQGRNGLNGDTVVSPVSAMDGYVSRLRTSNGSPIYFSAFSSGLANTSCYPGALVIDDARNAYVTAAIGNNSGTNITQFAGRTLTDGTTFSAPFSANVGLQNFVVAKLNASGDWQWASAPTLNQTSPSTGGASYIYAWATSLARDTAGALYLGGGVTAGYGDESISFASGVSVTAADSGGSGAFLAKLSDNGTTRAWQWALQTPRAGGNGAGPSFDTADVRAGFGGTAYWSVNAFSAAPIAINRSPTAADNAYDSATNRGAFLLPVLADAAYLSPTFSSLTTFVCGQEVIPPSGAYKDPATGRPLQPDIYLPGTTTSAAASFYWDTFGKRLFAVSATAAEVQWRVNSTLSSTARLSQVIATVWPTSAQGLITHVTGAGANRDEPKVSLEPAGGSATFNSILYTESAATISGAKIFSATGTGYSVLLYSDGRNSSPTSANVSLTVVRSYLWTDAAVRSAASATVGTALDPAAYGHSDPEGKTGYVVNRRARIDANGSAAAYSFGTQKGYIIPVNTEETTGSPAVDADSGDDLWVIWSRLDATKGVGWPAQAVRYTAAWPGNPEKIVVTSQLGSEMEVSGAKPARAILAGARHFVTSDGTAWDDDVSFTGGATVTNAVPIAGATTNDQPLYQKFRSGAAFSYSFPVPNGQYRVTLYFAEPAPPTTGTATKRACNISVEGVAAVSNLVVADRAGGVNTALTLAVPATVTDGKLDLAFAAPAGYDAAFVNAILVTPAQERLDPAKFTNLAVYNQPDKMLPGYNPNEEHALLAAPNLPTGVDAANRLAVFALRNDLNNVGVKTSDPYTLVRYQDATDGLKPKFKVYQVVVSDSRYSFSSFTGLAGTRIQPPYPLSLLPAGVGTSGSGVAYFKDRKNQVWAKSDGTLTARYFYGLQPDFWYDLNGDGAQDTPANNEAPWLDRYNKDTLGTTAYGTPVPVNYACVWPGGIPILYVGDTLTSARDGLPDIEQMSSATIIYEQSNNGVALTQANSAVRILPYTDQRVVSLPGARVDGTNLSIGGNGFAPVELDLASGYYRLRDLPYHLKTRLLFAPSAYDPATKTTGPALVFGGYKDASYAGRPLVLLNVLSAQELTRLLNFGGNAGNNASAWGAAVNKLYRLTRNPNAVDIDGTAGADDAFYAGFAKVSGANALQHANALGAKALTAGKAAGTLGYVTIAENNADGLGALPVALHIVQVQNPPVVGDLKVILSDNPLDEKITVRHGADFAGDPSGLTFEWYYQPATSATAPTTQPPGNGWILLTSGAGVNDYTFEGASLTTLADSWVYCRYKGYNANGYNAATFGAFAGDPAATTTARPAFVPGWIKRVLSGINPFEARVKNFASAPTETYSSALVSAGTRYEGDVALNNDPANLNSIGLISLYETVLRRGLSLSIDGSGGGQTNAAVNQSVLLAATRISDLYMLLGNEAYADAQDPTVGFTSADGSVGSLAPSLFAFQNEVPDLISEELALLRGRDDTSAGVGAAPVYNRLFWNFTKGLEGEPVYVQNYGVTDQNADGIINEKDAGILFPQGHGDAWGHYLSAVKSHYRLLRHPLYTWTPNSESTLISGVAVEVDYLDEQKFAAAAAARATVGSEIVNLTYRNAYTADPSGEWQGYRDTDATRAWGVVDWSRRAGQGAYFDWVTANAILPANHAHLLHNPIAAPSNLGPSDPAATGVNPAEPAPTGLQKIDRTTVTDLQKIADAYNKVQAQMDQADQGLNPLGLTPGSIPFDIDPNFNQIGSSNEDATHFEQIYGRTLAAINNARGVFDYASDLTNRLRQTQMSANDFAQDVIEQEHDFNSRLIEIFGYPYGGDIGSGKTYPTGYNGPDLYHYNYVAVNTVSGTSVVPDTSFNAFFKPFAQEYQAPAGGATNANDLQSVYSFYFPSDGNSINPTSANAVLTVPFPQATAADWSFAAPASWGTRRAPGSLQLSIGDMVRAEADLRRGILDYQNHLAAIQDQVDLLFARSGLQANNIQVLDKQYNTTIGLNAAIGTAQAVASASSLGADLIEKVADDSSDALPKVEGLATDILAPIRGVIKLAGTIGYGTLKVSGAVSEIAANAIELSKDQVNLSTELEIQKNDYAYDIQEQLKVIEGMLREDLGMRIDLFNLQQALTQATQQYQVTLAEGQRILEEQLIYRQKVAGVTQQNRYQDLAFRNFRNDALQKYRASFDLAARYVYLAATAYDFETVQLGTSSAAGRRFLTDIVRERALGQFDGNGNPVVGVNGLSDPLARLSQNFQVLKGRLGINNPQLETGQFSLRHEKFRLLDESDESWRAQLQSLRVADLWQVPEFRKYCRPFAPETAGAQPGLVIPFTTNITFGLNYFGLPLLGGDSSYDSTNYATKIRSAGVSFTGYGVQGLSTGPRIYLVPAGADVLRAPDDATLATRQFDVVDQAIPTPFPVGTAALKNPNYIPSNDSLDTSFNQLRQFSRFRAYADAGEDVSQLAGDTRLIGRSVWNTRWLLIIPGGTFLNDPNEGLDSFIYGQKVPGDSTGARDGKGVTDIKMFFETYSYSGN